MDLISFFGCIPFLYFCGTFKLGSIKNHQGSFNESMLVGLFLQKWNARFCKRIFENIKGNLTCRQMV